VFPSERFAASFEVEEVEERTLVRTVARLENAWGGVFYPSRGSSGASVERFLDHMTSAFS